MRRLLAGLIPRQRAHDVVGAAEFASGWKQVACSCGFAATGEVWDAALDGLSDHRARCEMQRSITDLVAAL